MYRPRRARLLAAVLLLGGLVPAARAQEPAEACPEGRISNVFIDNHSVFDLSDPDLSERFSWAYRLANRLHPPTRAAVIRRELLFREGDCYDVERLRDSERLLRGLEFIAGVDVFGVRQADGSIHVVVDTQDEWSLRVQAKVGGGGESGLTGLRLREDNLLGSGTHLSAFYRNRREEQVYGGSFYTPQLLGTRWDAALEAGRTPVGYLFSQTVAYPFVGEEGRWAFRQAVRYHDRYFEYLMPQRDELVRIWFPERRASFDIGGAYRFGTQRYNRTVVGAALAGEWVRYPQEARFADEEMRGLDPPPPGLHMDSISSVRAMFLFGQRNVYFVRERGLDTVNGTEDVRLGVEADIALGPSIPVLTRGRDLILDFALSAAGPLRGLGLAGANVLMEARRDYETPSSRSEWSDVFGQLNAWAYLRSHPESRSVLVASLTAAGAWHDAVPFQLTLGEDTGLRGFPDHVYPGERRVVGTVEARRYLGWPLPDLFDLGAVVFADIGKIWPGDAVFGVESPVQGDVGVGLRAAFPPGSRRTLRVDLGVPIGSRTDFRDVVLSVGVGQVVGARALSRDRQLLRSTRQGISTSEFLYPDYRP